ncbi:MAG: hypothetical protein ACFCGT_09570 [Sandaracinaceae bacterium]
MSRPFLPCPTPVAVGAVLVVLGVAALAEAQDRPLRVALLPTAGRDGEAVDAHVRDLLSSGFEVVEPADVAGAIGQRELEDVVDGAVSDVAVGLGADVVLRVVLEPERRPRTATLIAWTSDGTLAATEELDWRRREGPEQLDPALDALLGQARDGVERLRAAQPPPAPPPEERVPPPAPPADVEPEAPRGPPVLAVYVTAALRTRDAQVNLGEGRAARRYRSGAFPDLGVRLEVRPWAADPGLLRGLFARVRFGHSVGLDSRLVGTTDGVSSRFLRLEVGGGYLLALGDRVEVGGGVDGGFEGNYFGENVVFPSAEYPYLRPFGRVRGRILPGETLVAELEVAYRGVLGLGEIGTDFGTGSGANGIDLSLGVGGHLTDVLGVGLAWGLAFAWQRYGLSYNGQPGEVAAATDGWDRSFRFEASLGWAL